MILPIMLYGTVYIVEEEQRICISWHSAQIRRKVFLNYRNPSQFLEWGGIRKYCCDENWIAFFDSSGWKDSRKSLAENRVSHDIGLLTQGFIQSEYSVAVVCYFNSPYDQIESFPTESSQMMFFTKCSYRKIQFLKFNI